MKTKSAVSQGIYRGALSSCTALSFVHPSTLFLFPTEVTLFLAGRTDTSLFFTQSRFSLFYAGQAGASRLPVLPGKSLVPCLPTKVPLTPAEHVDWCLWKSNSGR